MPNPIVQVRGVSKSYRRDSMAIPVLHDISLDVPEGEFLGLMGPSGSGKTTLLNLIAGIDRPDKGAVSVAGTDVTKLSESELARWRARWRRAAPARPRAAAASDACGPADRPA